MAIKSVDEASCDVEETNDDGHVFLPNDRSQPNVQEGTPYRFRNYRPVDKDLNRYIADLSPALNIDDELREVLEEAQKFTDVEEIDLTSLAPKKVDWDLKRDVQGKLSKLERRTNAAIAELIKQRLVEGKQELLLTAMNSGVRAAEESHFSDED